MPREKKKARELADDQAMRKLFPKEVREAAKKTARDSRPKGR